MNPMKFSHSSGRKAHRRKTAVSETHTHMEQKDNTHTMHTEEVGSVVSSVM